MTNATIAKVAAIRNDKGAEYRKNIKAEIAKKLEDMLTNAKSLQRMVASEIEAEEQYMEDAGNYGEFAQRCVSKAAERMAEQVTNVEVLEALLTIIKQ